MDNPIDKQDGTDLSRRSLLGSAAVAFALGSALAAIGLKATFAAGNPHVTAYIVKRVPGMTIEQFNEY